MKRFLAFLAALLAVAVATAGCNASVTPPAATVGSTSISASELNAAMTNVKGDAGFLCTSSDGSTPVSNGVAAGTWSMSFADEVLSQLVKFAVLDQMVAEHHLSVPASDFNQAKVETEASVENSLQSLEQESTPVTCPGTPASIVNALGSTYGTRFIDNQLNQDAYSAYLAGTSLQPVALTAWEQGHRAITTESCTSVIGYSTKAAAVAAKAAIAGGTSFVAEAAKSTENIGAGAGGVIGCITPDQLAPALGSVLTSLAIGAVSQPVSYNGIYLLFTVTSRHLEPINDLVLHIDSLEQQAFNAAYGKALSGTPIDVSSVYGSFESKAVQGVYTVAVLPPSDKACSFALSGAASGCP